ncbi:MAG: hypothetical protein Q8N67_01600, partial [Candidatus Omnitrophota bacterium]|nr:hypothetical protein [Candidatus Omnitrophota bacterium]
MRFKISIISLFIVIILLLTALVDSFASSAEIKSVMKIQRMGGYILLINYEKHEKWTDSIIFKVYCKFSE